MISAAELSERLGLPPPTDEQAAVVESGLDPAVVIAGAGSGKTETMAARVVWLVANRLVDPESVLGLTFTRKAAAELGKRIRRRLAQWRHVVEQDSPENLELLALLRAGEPTVSTYAAYAGRLVGEQALRLGAEPDARLLSPAQGWQLADSVVRASPGPLPGGIGTPGSIVGWVLAMAGQFADHLVTPDDVEGFCTAALASIDEIATRGRLNKTGPVAELIASLQHRQALVGLTRDFAAAKAAVPAVDFGDQMALAARLAGIAEVQAVERARYRAVLLDEYQDTGHAQVELLHGLFGGGHPVTAVGDPFQSIYGWRGASAGNIEAFDRRFTRSDAGPATVYPLATSFRNDRLILDAANAVARELRSGPTTVELRPRAGAGPGTIELVRTETHDDEARWVAERMRAAWQALPGRERTAAVLVRRRTQIPLLAEALQDVGLPVEIVGLGGLLTTPEVADVVSTLRVLADHEAAPSLARLLVGARWRIGPRDLAALHDRARWLGRGDDGAAAVEDDERFTIIEALDDLGPAERYSAAGYARLDRLAGELRRLRRRVGAPLSELVAEIERVIGIDIEVAARADRAAVGRAHLDRFLDEAALFAAEASDTRGATLTAFLAYLDAAEEEENGLEAGEVVVETERVQLLTVHGAKGLEWDVVAVPGLVSGVFPADPRSVNWTRARHELPIPLRGDRGDLPELVIAGAADPKELGDLLKDHDGELKRRHAREERRLAYVALTRAKSVLLGSAYVWDANVKPRELSPFLVELLAHREPLAWFEPEPDAVNPVTARTRTGLWPIDPLGPHGGSPSAAHPGRRADVEAGAALVRAALTADAGQGTLFPELPAGSPPTAVPTADRPPALPAVGRPAEWPHDVDLLLAERARLRRGDVIEVELPAQLSVSQLVELERDAGELARRIRRPVPRPPAPWARRGTAFHTWLEQRWQAQTLLDVDELPGAADAAADDSEFLALREAFERSEWAERTPAEVEVPFEMAVAAGTLVRGRMDAVFGSAADGWLVVDWKTGRKPAGTAAEAAAVQLAAYRLAWARLQQIPDGEVHRVRAAFHYVRSGETVQPADLLDADGLRALVVGSATTG
ncbi:MAG: UvrD-helicase domain-containing protein [Jatrophihabitantaceae bacterium]